MNSSKEIDFSTAISTLNIFSIKPEKYPIIGTYSDISEQVRDKYSIPTGEPKNSNNLKVLDTKYQTLSGTINEYGTAISTAKLEDINTNTLINTKFGANYPIIEEEKKSKDSMKLGKNSAVKVKSALNSYLERFRHLIFGNDVSDKKFFKHALLVHNGLVYASKSLMPPSDNFLQSKKINLPDKKLSLFKTISIIKIINSIKFNTK